jgi:uncharacterized membrane protein
MSKCNKCGAEVKEHAKYCKACGSSLLRTGASLNEKKARVMSGEKKWVKTAAIAAAVILAVGAAWMLKAFYMSKLTGSHPMFPPHRDLSARLTTAVPVKEQGGDVHIPVKTVDDGKAHFFAYTADGKTVTFFVMKAQDGSFRTALDACVACNHAKLGYRQEGALVVCNNCGMGFKPTDIGMMTGGCNPIPLNRSMDGQLLVLKAKDLEDGAQYF